MNELHVNNCVELTNTEMYKLRDLVSLLGRFARVVNFHANARSGNPLNVDTSRITSPRQRNDIRIVEVAKRLTL